MTDVWVLFKKGIPMDVYMSKESAENNKFESEKVEHFIHVEDVDAEAKTREEQLVRANFELSQRVEELTRMLERAEKRMGVIEQLGGVPVLLRKGRVA